MPNLDGLFTVLGLRWVKLFTPLFDAFARLKKFTNVTETMAVDAVRVVHRHLSPYF